MDLQPLHRGKVIPIATTLTFTQGSPDYDYAGGGPVGTGRGEVGSAGDGLVRITLWPTRALPLPATIARTAQGIVVESSMIWGMSLRSSRRSTSGRQNSSRAGRPGWRVVIPNHLEGLNPT